MAAGSTGARRVRCSTDMTSPFGSRCGWHLRSGMSSIPGQLHRTPVRLGERAIWTVGLAARPLAARPLAARPLAARPSAGRPPRWLKPVPWPAPCRATSRPIPDEAPQTSRVFPVNRMIVSSVPRGCLGWAAQNLTTPANRSEPAARSSPEPAFPLVLRRRVGNRVAGPWGRRPSSPGAITVRDPRRGQI